LEGDIDLVKRCLDSDPKAQKMLYRRFAAKMYGICLRYSNNAQDAEDLLQEGFIRVFDNLHRFRNEGTLDGWIRRIFVNQAINFYRRVVRFPRELPLEEVLIAEPEEHIISRLTRNEVLELIQTLPPGYRTVFNLYVIEGYTHNEIGKLLHISENTSKSQLFEARRTLRRLLGNREKTRNGEQGAIG
jgi:RNA polymerase sigma-70 factor (ECF subfamily)